MTVHTPQAAREIAGMGARRHSQQMSERRLTQVLGSYPRKTRRELETVIRKFVTTIEFAEMFDRAPTPEFFAHCLELMLHYYREMERNRKKPDAAVTAGMLPAIDAAVVSQTERDQTLRGGEYEIACRKGCDHCCHLAMHITQGEAELMVGAAQAKGVEIDRARLERQRAAQAAPDEYEGWASMPYEDRACAFLRGGECSIYEARPSVCRKYFVLGDPDQCDTRRFPGGRVGRWVVIEAEAIVSAHMTFRKHGAQPALLLEALDERDRQD